MARSKEGSSSKRRSIKNLIVDKDMQKRLSLYFMSINFCVSGIALLVLAYYVGQVHSALQDVPNLDYLGHEAFAKSLIGLMSTSVIAVFVTILVNFLCGIYLTHRFAGPMMVINEYIEDLIDGKYGSNRELRPNDELKPIMNKLKRLSQKLQETR